MKKVLITAVMLAGSGAWAGPVKESGIRGGLAVVIGGDVNTALAIGGNEAFLVQMLATDATQIAAAREAIRTAGLYGRVSARVFDGTALPYTNNLVNLVVVQDGAVGGEEIRRVLAPRGVALGSPLGKSYAKPVPETIDEWTHYLYSPDNNAVARDTVVGPPRRYQWIGRPRFSRSHDHLASVTALVSAGGRVFSIVDEGPVAFAAADPDWKLVARDAFNGKRLWERGIAEWEYHLRDFRSGPADIARRLVAVGDRVYVTLGYGRPVTALDAATGKTVMTCAETAGAREILCDGDSLFLVLGEPHTSWDAGKAQEIVKQKAYSPPFEKITPPARALRVARVSADTGRIKWINDESCARNLMPATLTLSGGRVFFHNLDALVCLDAQSGKLLWKADRPIQRRRLAWSSPTVVASDGVVYAADRAAEITDGDLLWLPSGGYHQYIRGDKVGGRLVAYDADDGSRLWDCPVYEGFNAAVDIFIADGLLWTGRYAWGNDPGITAGRDPKTGAVKRTRPSDKTILKRIGHARCHRAKATAKYLVLGRRGIEFVDLRSGEMIANLWVRGVCGYGVMPANGLIYAPPHSCACSVDGLIKSGFIALAGADFGGNGAAADGPRLHKGPAGSRMADLTFGVCETGWPTYRRDASRSGSIKTAVPSSLKEGWRTEIGGTLTPPVAAGGMVLVAAVERHTVHALDAGSGETLWRFTAGGRVDSPPTICCPADPAKRQPGNTLCIFGCRDGYVYCLRASDGALAWRYRAAPRDRLIAVDGQLESAWPVHGSVLVVDNAACFAVGRDSFLDGGIFLHKLNVGTGAVLKTRQLEIEKEKRDTGSAGGFLPDVLAADETRVFMRGACFSRDDLDHQRKAGVPHLWSSVGFLDHTWWHRTYWQYGTKMGSGWGGWHKEAQKVPVGRLLVTDGSRIYGYGRNNYDNAGAHVGVDGRFSWGPVRSPFTFYRLFGRPLKGKKGTADWTCRIPVVGRALVLAGDTLFVAGPDNPAADIPRDPAATDAIVEAVESDRGGRLLAVSPADGTTRGEDVLKSPPVFDGMIAAGGRLYLSTRAGTVVCLK